MDFYEFGPFKLDRSPPALYRGGKFISLTPKALDTLVLLVEQAGRIVTKDQLMEYVWPDAFVEDGNLASNISTLRKVLNPHFKGDSPIATIARRGYRFTAPVTAFNAPPAPTQALQTPQAPQALKAPQALLLIAVALVILITMIGIAFS